MAFSSLKELLTWRDQNVRRWYPSAWSRQSLFKSLGLRQYLALVCAQRFDALTIVYETCRDRIIPLFPVISVSESLLADRANQTHVDKYAQVDPNSTPPTPLPHIVRMIHCAIASRSRDVPFGIRASILHSLHNLLQGPEFLRIASTRCLASVQVLMLLNMCDEIHAPDGIQARENLWQHLGTAVKSAFAIVSPMSLQLTIGTASTRVYEPCAIFPAKQAVESLGSLPEYGSVVGGIALYQS